MVKTAKAFAEQAGIKGGEIVAVWGTGPVGLFAIQSAKPMFGSA